MRYIKYTLYLFLLFAFNGCGLFFNATSLTPDQKKVVYQNVNNELDELKERSERLLETGYLAQAVEDFERINFYEDSAVIPVAKIQKTKAKAKTNAKNYYDKGVKLQATDKKQALAEFNKMLRNDPTYQDGKKRFEELKKESTNAKMLASLETELNTQLKSDLQNAKSLSKLGTALEALIEYDDGSPSVIQAKLLLEEQRQGILEEGIELYNAQKYDTATKKFELVVQIYKKDSTAQKYLDRIDAKQESQKRLKLARNALEDKDYHLAIRHAERVLDNDPSNNEAQNIIDTATKKYEQSIPDLISKGVELYNKQDMQNALKVFKSIIDIDSDNATSTVYVKKITQQLETIKKLK